ncbi:hypothetical protein DFH08DRAFT_798779 [Mycena albidolilacea]|uniref:Uncharacterized protein n=1 Tax=Mycena albidolilacea TaxID=1033008 RepID=A0AAD7AQA8_9AGAR|nr:hypothetical protein DFH08DRAFT_798779 [Mycena albidolilacea]
MCGESSDLRRQKDVKPRINEPGGRNEMFNFVLGVAAALDVNYQQRIVRARLTGILVPGRRKIDDDKASVAEAHLMKPNYGKILLPAKVQYLRRLKAPTDGIDTVATVPDGSDKDSPSQNLVQATTLQIGVLTKTPPSRSLRIFYATAGPWLGGVRLNLAFVKSMGHPRVHAEWYRTRTSPYPTPTGVRVCSVPLALLCIIEHRGIAPAGPQFRTKYQLGAIKALFTDLNFSSTAGNCRCPAASSEAELHQNLGRFELNTIPDKLERWVPTSWMSPRSKWRRPVRHSCTRGADPRYGAGSENHTPYLSDLYPHTRNRALPYGQTVIGGPVGLTTPITTESIRLRLPPSSCESARFGHDDGVPEYDVSILRVKNFKVNRSKNIGASLDKAY